jgi:hypothetical protein
MNMVKYLFIKNKTLLCGVLIFMKKKKLFLSGFVSAALVFAYVSGVSLLLNNGEALFGKVDNKMWLPVAMLLLLVFSVAAVGILIFARPVLLYLDGAKKEAVCLLAYTIVCLFLFMFLVFSYLFVVS